MRGLRGVALALALIAAFLGCAGATYQLVGTWRDERRFQQRGKSFRVGTIKLNLDCDGQGSPTVVLDGGLGSPALDWIQVQPEIAKFTRVCSWDRPGYGWSDPSPEPRTSLQISKELRAPLTIANERKPYILVGYSLGGYNVRVFTGKYPADVAGVVLVDASHPDEEDRIGAVLPPALRDREKQYYDRQEMWDHLVAPLRIYLGIQRLSLALSRDQSKDSDEEFLYLDQQPKYRRAVEAENRLSPQSGEQARAAGNLGDRPLIVLTAGRPYDPEPMLTADQLEKQREIWINVLQAEEARLSSRGRQIVVPDSGHAIPSERPGAVISAIREVWIAARKSL